MYSIHTHTHTPTHTHTHTYTLLHTLTHTNPHIYKASQLLCGYAKSLCIKNVDKRVKVHRSVIAFYRRCIMPMEMNIQVTYRINILIAGVAD